MVTFTDEFNRTAGALGSSWQSLNSNNSTSAVVVANTRAISNDLAYQAVAWRIATASIPTTGEQEVDARIISATQGTNCHVDVGVMGTTAAASYSTVPLGVWARFAWLANGVRRLTIHRFLPGDASSATLRTVDLVLAGSIPADGHEGRLVADGAVGYEQRLRLVVTSTDGGLLARAYVNEADVDRPTLAAVVDRDLLDTGVADQEFGAIWMGFGPSAGTSGDQAVLAIFGGDFDSSEDHAPQEIRVDQPTLGEALRRVRSRYEGLTSTTLRDDTLRDVVTDTIEDLLNLWGDGCWFMRREDTLSLAPAGLTQQVTLPANMRRIHSIVDASTRCEVRWELLYHTTAGAPVVRLNTSIAQDYLVAYTLRHAQISEDRDVLPIPREYLECLVVGACQKMASRDRKQALELSLAAEYQRLIATARIDMARHRNAERSGLRARRLPFGYARG